MPLLDHFHEPALSEAPWESFTTMWVSSIVGALNRQSPQGRFRAFAQIHLGPQVEADIAEFEELPPPSDCSGHGTVALATDAPPSLMSVAALFPDDIEIRIQDMRANCRLVAVIELVSPGNKKESAERRLFVAKCAAYLQQGIGPVIVDAVTSRRANLHDELADYLQMPAETRVPEATAVYATAYRPTVREKQKLRPLARTADARRDAADDRVAGQGLVARIARSGIKLSGSLRTQRVVMSVQ